MMKKKHGGMNSSGVGAPSKMNKNTSSIPHRSDMNVNEGGWSQNQQNSQQMLNGRGMSNFMQSYN